MAQPCHEANNRVKGIACSTLPSSKKLLNKNNLQSVSDYTKHN